jgi:hypothetical protein
VDALQRILGFMKATAEKGFGSLEDAAAAVQQ